MVDAPSPPERSSAALLLIDLINDMEFPGGDVLFRRVKPIAPKIARLAARARAAKVPVIYTNDNFGHWRSDFRTTVEHCLSGGVRGGPIVEQLQPEASDYFVLKPKNSAFFGTPLEQLLATLGASTLILTGVAGDNCVLFTAHDAHMRELRIFVPSDCVASESARANRWALEHMARFLDADTRPSARLDLRRLRRAGRTSRQRRGVTAR